MDTSWKDVQKPYDGPSLNEQPVYTSGYMKVLAQQGWQCPLCNRIYGPFVQECYHCNNQKSTLTTTTYPDTTTTGGSQSYTVTYPATKVGKHSVIKSTRYVPTEEEKEELEGKHVKKGKHIIKGGN